MIHTKVLIGALITLYLLIEPKQISKPNGKANSNVNAKSCNVVPKPLSSANVTSINLLINYLPLN